MKCSRCVNLKTKCHKKYINIRGSSSHLYKSILIIAYFFHIKHLHGPDMQIKVVRCYHTSRTMFRNVRKLK